MSSFRLPSWFGSLLLHAAGFLLLFYLIPFEPRIKGAPGFETTGDVGIVLKTESEEGTVYTGEDGTLEPSGGAPRIDRLSDLIEETESLFETDGGLPLPVENAIGPSAAANEAGGAGRAGDSAGSLVGNGFGSGMEGAKATVRVFGLQGTGSRFAYVFDRSLSMSEPNHRPIRAAKVELLASLDALKSNHQLAILFYNEDVTIFPSPKTANHLIFATDINKESAHRFVDSVVPTGGTDHEKAILAAAKWGPDVIFLLTDGEAKDDLHPGQWDRVSRRVGGIQINVIQFGTGTQPSGNNYLKRLASENRGQYRYIPIGSLTEK